MDLCYAVNWAESRHFFFFFLVDHINFIPASIHAPAVATDNYLPVSGTNCSHVLFFWHSERVLLGGKSLGQVVFRARWVCSDVSCSFPESG